MFQIENSIPAPKTHGRMKYPFALMRKGESFFVPNGLQQSICTAGAAWALRQGNGHKFTVRKVDGGIRCWRVE